MKFSTGLFALALSFDSVLATVPEWGQCGGIDYTGLTSKFLQTTTVRFNIQYPNLELGCVPSTVCTMVNRHYLQCQTPTTTETMAYPSSTEFVTTSGTNFMLDGSKYTVVG